MARSKNTGCCPRHGVKYMTREGASFYCGAPTPGEISKKCFYHPNANHPKETKTVMKRRKLEARSKPNLWKVMEEEWNRHKKNRITNHDKARIKAKEKLVSAY